MVLFERKERSSWVEDTVPQFNTDWIVDGEDWSLVFLKRPNIGQSPRGDDCRDPQDLD